MLQVAALMAVGAVAVLHPGSGHWDPGLALLLTAFAITSDLTGVETGSSKLKVSGSFLAIVVGMVLLGGVPAAGIGIASIAVGWLRWREAGHYLRNNLVAYAVFPLLAGLAFHEATDALGLTPASIGFYLLIFAAFTLALVLNFTAVAGYQCLLDGTSLRRKAREALMPLLSSELASALLSAGTVYLYEQAGIEAVAMVGVVILVFQHLVGQLLVSHERGERLREQVLTDPLTTLGNRALFLERLEAAVAEGRPHGVMIMDLDGFKEVNDALGHDYGDRLLTALSQRLLDAIGDDDVLARLGGDEFAVLAGHNGVEALDRLARELLASVQQPVLLDEITLEVSASIGIVRYPHDGGTAQVLIRRADVAMYAAKRSGATCEFYTPERDARSRRRLQLLSDLRRGLRRGELALDFQPEVDLARPGVHAVEALVRWDHPGRGRLAPSSFVELAEHGGMIKPLTEEVLDLALSHVVDWRRRGLDLKVAVNLSARTLGDRRLPDQIAAQIANAGLDPSALALEITETMVLQDPTRAMATLEALQALGIELSIDDFGTGYSSLAYLKRLPISEVKVDRSFVSTMTTDPVDAVIVRSTIELAHSLGLRTVAEGVEDGATLVELAALGCDLAQGYHLSRPLEPEQLYHWARRVADRRWVLPTALKRPVERLDGPAALPEMPAPDVSLRRRLASNKRL